MRYGAGKTEFFPPHYMAMTILAMASRSVSGISHIRGDAKYFLPDVHSALVFNLFFKFVDSAYFLRQMWPPSVVMGQSL